MRILNLLPLLPYPPQTGGHLRAWNLCAQVGRYSELTVLCRTKTIPTSTQLDAFADAHIRLLTVHVPSPSVTAKLCKASRLLFSHYPLRVGGWDHAPIRRCLRELLANESFDIVVLDSSMLCSYAPLLRHSSAMKVVNLYDIEADALARKAALLRPGVSRLMARADAWKMKGAERRLVEAMDLVLTPSQKDRDTLRQRNVTQPIAVVPNGVSCRTITPLPYTNRGAILFVGALNYHPNTDAVQFFASAVWPVLRRLFPELSFHVVGRDPPLELQHLHGDAGIHVTGNVDSLAPAYQDASVVVVPLRAGGGTRLKILEAFAYGRPVVSTTLGCEGLDVEDGRHLLLADSPEQLCSQVARLLRHPSLATTLIREGRRLVEERYAWESIAETLYRRYLDLLGPGPVERPSGHEGKRTCAAFADR